MQIRIVIILLLTLLLTSYTTSSIYAVEESKPADKPADKPSDTGPNTPDVSPNPGETNDKNVVEKQTPTEPVTPPSEPEPKQLPKCDGSKQDCITRNGDTCKAGEGGDKCECLPDNSDCPNNPNVITNPIIPSMTIKSTTPDFECHFHPNDKHCAPDANGNCPPGFAHNQQGNCHPSGPCPTGFSRHDDDETGTCFPGPNVCHKGFHLGPHHTCIKTIVVVKHSSSNSNSNSHNLSNSCFNEIKIAWIGKITRGENSKVDKIIDNCLNVK